MWRLFFPKHELQYQEHPRDAVKDKVKPVQGPDETPLEEHNQLFHKVRGLIGSKAECEAENDDHTPWQLIEKVFHI